MRALLPLGILLLAPLALAQTVLPGPSASIVAQPFPDVVHPLEGALGTPFEVHVSCDAGRVAPPTSITLAITQKPAWAEVVVSPESFMTSDAQPCEHELVFFGTLSAQTSDQAPAFYAALVELEATVAQPLHAIASGKASIPLTAGFFSVVDVSAKDTILHIPPGGDGTIDLVVTNFGNANTKVILETKALASGLAFEQPLPIVLQSKQAGGSAISSKVRIDVARTADVASPIPIVVTWRSSYALDPSLVGDAGEVKMMVVAGAPEELFDAASLEDEDVPARVPTPPLAAVLSLVLGLALVLRRR